MTVISAKLSFFIPQSESLKDKRMVARSIIDKTRRKFNAAVSQVDMQDMHKTLIIGVAVVSGEYAHARKMLDEIIRFMEENADAGLNSIEIG